MTYVLGSKGIALKLLENARSFFIFFLCFLGWIIARRLFFLCLSRTMFSFPSLCSVLNICHSCCISASQSPPSSFLCLENLPHYEAKLVFHIKAESDRDSISHAPLPLRHMTLGSGSSTHLLQALTIRVVQGSRADCPVLVPRGSMAAVLKPVPSVGDASDTGHC